MAIPPTQQQVIAQQLQRLAGPVKIDYFHQTDAPVLVPGRRPCPSCAVVKEALQEIAALSPQIALRVHEFAASAEAARKWDIDAVPAIVVRGELNRPLRFFGTPAGAFLPAFIGGPPALAETLHRLRRPIHVRVLASLAHAASGPAMAAACALALASPRVRVTVYAIDEFPELGARLRINRIPATFMDDRIGFAGSNPGVE